MHPRYKVHHLPPRSRGPRILILPGQMGRQSIAQRMRSLTIDVLEIGHYSVLAKVGGCTSSHLISRASQSDHASRSGLIRRLHVCYYSTPERSHTYLAARWPLATVYRTIN